MAVERDHEAVVVGLREVGPGGVTAMVVDEADGSPQAESDWIVEKRASTFLFEDRYGNETGIDILLLNGCEMSGAAV